MEGVRAGLDRRVDQCHPETKLGRKRVFLNLELLDSVDRGQEVPGPHPEVSRLRPVDKVVRIFRSLAVDDDGKFPSNLLIDFASAAALRLADAWDKLGQVQIVPPIQGKVHNRLILNYLAG